jgi:hypothetical protein
MATPAQDKYYLRTLHEEIDLFDRKLAHMLKYDTFTSDAERAASESKLKAKRELLVRTARQLAASGIDFKVSELPRSFRTEEMTAELAQQVLAEPEATASVSPVLMPRKRQLPASPYAGTMLDPRADIEAYKRNRTKTGRTHS